MDGGKRKAKRPKTEPEVPLPQTLLRWVASQTITDETRFAAYRSSLKAHAERVEDKMVKEYPLWLIKFGYAVDKVPIRTQAWEKLKFKCDISKVVRCLYLFTHSGTTSADVVQDAWRFLKDGLDGLLPKYSNISEDTSTLFNHPKLRLLTVLSNKVPQVFVKPMQSIATAEQTLETIRAWAEKMGSYKTDAHDIDLYEMATIVRSATGKYHFPELATLVEAARIAHGKTKDHPDEDVLRRRVHRFISRMNLANL